MLKMIKYETYHQYLISKNKKWQKDFLHMENWWNIDQQLTWSLLLENVQKKTL